MRSLFEPVIACFAIALICGAVSAAESKVALSDVPQAGVTAVKAMFPAAEITGAAKETENGKTFFEVTLKQKGRTIDVTVGVDGKIQLVEKEISDKDLPKTVLQAIAVKYPQAIYKIVEQVDIVKDGQSTLDFFEALIETTGKKRLEVQVSPDGKIRNEEEKAPADAD